MKFLIAGLGSIGRRHLRNLLALGEHDIVLYRTRRASLPDDELASFPVETDLQAALAHRPDAVIISNPTALHLDVAIPAAQAGCHLFLEKPVSHSMERVDKLEAAVARSGVKALVGFQFRFHPGLQLVKRLLTGDAGHPSSVIGHRSPVIGQRSSVIGRPVSFRAHWGEYLPGWHPWEDYRQGYSARADLGGGVILTLCHPLDYLRWLLGDVASLWAFAGHLSDLDLQVEDTAEIGLKFRSGAIGSVHLNYVQRPPEHSLELIGTHGTVRWDNADGVVSLYIAHSPVGALPTGERPYRTRGRGGDGTWRTFPPPANFERNWMFIEEMRHFLAVCRGEAEPVCTLRDGVESLRLALGAVASNQCSVISHQ